ncbi:MAG: 6-carboxytetrahydropterin synthase [Halobacteriovoraceae bacterium]|nr:6-carboxytetrahydropterin synthase [Halobacteriovoraceae bacterium]
MQTCVRKIHFCYGHRVKNHESKCATLHGHNGVIWVHATPIEGLDKLGRVIDFSVLKDKVGGWVDQYWDHTMILFEQDTETLELVKKAPSFKEVFILPKNPTAENLAEYLLKEICPKVLSGSGVIVHKIVFWETENCYAEQSLDPSSPEIRSLYGA